MIKPTLLSRVWRDDSGRSVVPSVVTVRGGDVVDITSKHAPTVRDVYELDDPARSVSGAEGEVLDTLKEILAAPFGDETVSLNQCCNVNGWRLCKVG